VVELSRGAITCHPERFRLERRFRHTWLLRAKVRDWLEDFQFRLVLDLL